MMKTMMGAHYLWGLQPLLCHRGYKVGLVLAMVVGNVVVWRVKREGEGEGEGRKGEEREGEEREGRKGEEEREGESLLFRLLLGLLQ